MLVRRTVMQGLALCTLLIGIKGALQTENLLLVILSMVVGGVAGSLLDIGGKMDRLGAYAQRKLGGGSAGDPADGGLPQESTFAQGFVTASLVFCVGAMAIVGSLQDGLSGNYTTLFAKSILDGISSLLLGASLGFGVAMSAVPLFIYQGGITILAQFIKPALENYPLLIGQISCIGSILIVAIGFNMLFGKKIKVGNLLPAIFFPIIFALLKSVFPGLPL